MSQELSHIICCGKVKLTELLNQLMATLMHDLFASWQITVCNAPLPFFIFRRKYFPFTFFLDRPKYIQLLNFFFHIRELLCAKWLILKKHSLPSVSHFTEKKKKKSWKLAKSYFVWIMDNLTQTKCTFEISVLWCL